MAHGLMIYLTDEECKNVKLYLGLNKTYRFKILFGVSTDTYDILGKITSFNESNIDLNLLRDNLDIFKGEYEQEYPPFSSQVVDKKPLWKHSLDNTLTKITIPKKKINIYDLRVISNTKVNFKDLQENILYRINLLQSNKFRKKEIISNWEKINLKNAYIVELEAEVSSGTYIRSLCHRIGKFLNTNAIAYDIFRTKIGNYDL